MNIKPIDTFPPLHCPHCGTEAGEGFTWTGGETVESKSAPETCSAEVMWGGCPQCGENIYALGISVVPDCPAGMHHVNDGQHQSNSVSYYSVEGHNLDAHWGIEHYTDVSSVLFQDTNTKGEAREDRTWMDIHYISPLTADDPYDAIKRVGPDSVEKCLPFLQEISWDQDQ